MKGYDPQMRLAQRSVSSLPSSIINVDQISRPENERASAGQNTPDSLFTTSQDDESKKSGDVTNRDQSAVGEVPISF